MVLSSEILNNKIAITDCRAGDCAHAPIDYSILVCVGGEYVVKATCKLNHQS